MEAQRLQDPRAEERVPLDLFEFVGRERAGLPQDDVAHADLADVMKQRTQAERLDVLFRQLQLPSDRHRQARHPLRMTRRVRIPRVERRRKRANHAEIRRLGFRFGQPDGRSQRVKGFRQRIELLTDAAGGHRLIEGALRCHVRQASRQVMNR